MFEVIKDSPIPARPKWNSDYPYGKQVQKYPTTDLQVGDSFVFPIEERKLIANSAARIKFRRKLKGVECDFLVHKISKTEAQLWRIA